MDTIKIGTELNSWFGYVDTDGSVIVEPFDEKYYSSVKNDPDVEMLICKFQSKDLQSAKDYVRELLT